MKIPLISAAVQSADWGEFRSEITEVVRAGADWLHFDISDGTTGSPLTFGPRLISIAQETAKVTFDVHIQGAKPQALIRESVEAGASIIYLQTIPGTNLNENLSLVRSLGARSGIELTADMPLESLDSLGDSIDLILVNPKGVFGEEALSRVTAVRDYCNQGDIDITLVVEGEFEGSGVEPALNAGADVLVLGSQLFGTPDYKETLKKLKGLNS